MRAQFRVRSVERLEIRDLLAGDVALDGFVDVADANTLLSYDQLTGDIVVTALVAPMTSVHLISNDGIFVGTETNDYTIGLFDRAGSNKYFRLDPAGLDSIELLGMAQTGLTLEQFAADVEPDGSLLSGEPLSMALVTPTESIIAICESHLASGAIPGDANLDGTFDSGDLTQIFQAGEYFDKTEGNSNWRDGDWNCDAEFNSGDLVAAFQAGQYVGGALLAVADHPLDRDAHSQQQEFITAAERQVVGEENQKIGWADHVGSRSLFEYHNHDKTRAGVAIDAAMKVLF